MKPDSTHNVNQTAEATDWQGFIEEMPDTALQQSGLVDVSYRSQHIFMRELTGIALVRIHSLRPFSVLQEGMARCGIQLPANVNQSIGQDPAALCLSPGEWMLFSEFLGYMRLIEQVRIAVDNHHNVALDFSAGLTVFRLAGSGIPWLLAKLSGLDFGGALPPAAYCARTRLQHVAAMLHYHQPGGLATESVFDLIVDRSVARYLWELLIASAPHAEELEQQFAKG